MKFLIYDTETTGLSHKAEVISFASVILDLDERTGNFQISEPVELFSRPSDEAEISEKALEVNGYKREDFPNFPDKAEFEDFYARLLFKHPYAIPVAHNASFDVRMLKQSFDETLFDSLSRDSICSLQFAKQLQIRKMIPFKQKLNLRALYDAYALVGDEFIFKDLIGSVQTNRPDLTSDRDHSALSDVVKLALLWRTLFFKYEIKAIPDKS